MSNEVPKEEEKCGKGCKTPDAITHALIGENILDQDTRSTL